MNTTQLEPTRTQTNHRRLHVLHEAFRPVYVVWELTLRCDHACTHCGSRAARARPDELTTEQALAVVPQLAEMGTKEVVLIGGEAYLHAGFLHIVEALHGAGMVPVLTTGGRGITPQLATAMACAGLARASVSIDGKADAHDRMRARIGSFAQACLAVQHLQAAGIYPSANTNINRSNQADLEELYEVLRALGVKSWQIQLTAPLGRAADRPDMLLQPWDLLDLLPRIAALKERGLRDGLLIMPGNNLGYFGDEEELLRSAGGGGEYFAGCQAGRFVMGIESHGAVKGCPSLPSAVYVGGNVQQKSLRDIWQTAPQLQFARARSRADLWGFCATCPFADTCLGGCSFTAHAFFGKPGNNPYCHYRARVFAANGQRERLVQRARAPGQPFDHGQFALEVEQHAVV